jgi:hypothetical protein
VNELVSLSIEGMHLVASCLTHQRFAVSPSRRERLGTWSVEFREPTPLRGHGLLRGSRLALEVDLHQPGDGLAAETTRYAYTLLDHADRELLAWHWHPRGRSPVAFPHLHVSSALRGTTPSGGPAVLPLDKVHLPTGHISVADVVKLLVGDLGIAPLRADWLERLDRAATMLPAFPA